MNEEEKSNKEGVLSAEVVEEKTLPKRNNCQTTAVRTQSLGTASNMLFGVRQAARQKKYVQFTALLHHITIELLEQSYFSLKRNSAPGVDGVMWQAYGENLTGQLTALHSQIHK